MIQNHRFLLFCDAAMAYAIYALIFFIPISSALVEIFSALTILLYLIKRSVIFGLSLQTERDHQQTRTFFGIIQRFLLSFKPVNSILNLPITIFMVVCLVSVFFSQYPRVGIMGFLGKILQNAFVYFALIECINSKKRIYPIVFILLFSCMLVSSSGLVQYFFGKDFIRNKIFFGGRVNACFRAPNDLAAFLITLIPIFLGFFIFRPDNVDSQGRWTSTVNTVIYSSLGKSVLFVAVSLSLVCLGLTYSRGAWLALFLSLSVLCFYRKKIFVIFLFISIIFVLFYSFKMLSERPHLDINAFLGSSGREIYWKEAVNMIKDYPLLGVGLNAYSQAAKKYRLEWGGYPHNCFLQMAAETGVVGFLSFLWILFRLFWNSYQSFFRMKDGFMRPFLLGAMAGLGGFLIHSFFDTFMYSVQLGVLMWIMIGLIVSAQKIELGS